MAALRDLPTVVNAAFIISFNVARLFWRVLARCCRMLPQASGYAFPARSLTKHFSLSPKAFQRDAVLKPKTRG